MNDVSKVDLQIRVELAREAKDLLDNRAFVTALGVLKQQWVNEIINDATDAPKVQELTAKLRALEAIPALLRSLLAGPQLAQRGDHVRRSG